MLSILYHAISDITIERLQILLEKSMKNFSDKLHIKHDSVLQQEG